MYKVNASVAPETAIRVQCYVSRSVRSSIQMKPVKAQTVISSSFGVIDRSTFGAAVKT